jgi:hypothetical protein
MPLRFAYADPPYVGQAKLYPEHPDAVRWDDPAEHIALMRQLDEEYDGWALSCSSPSLGTLLASAPAGVRVAAWVKPFAAFKRNVRVAYTWEPVIWRRIAPRRPDDPVGRDHVSVGITLRKGLTGTKPEPFAEWLLKLLGWQPGDELVDLFPGLGTISLVADRQAMS